MIRSRLFILAAVLTAAALQLTLALPSPAQVEGEHNVFRLEMEELNREGKTVNPLLLMDLSCADGSSPCAPVLRLFGRTATADHFRLPALPPLLSAIDGRIEPDKKQLKADKENTALFAKACGKLPNADACDGDWELKKVWTLAEPLANGAVALSLRTKLLKPGATNSQIVGAVGPEQVLQMQFPFAPEKVVVPIWELNGNLTLPEIFAVR